MVQITVVAITMGLLSVGIYGASQIKVAFDPFKLLDQSGYLSKFFDVYHEGKGSTVERVTTFQCLVDAYK